MPVEHYENFPVASLLLPKKLRYPIEIIYHFARTADDIADEGELENGERLQQLNLLQDELEAIKSATEPINNPDQLIVAKIDRRFIAKLAEVIRQYDLPIELFSDLLSAFAQDVEQKYYANFALLSDYARRSANPIGRLILHLHLKQISELQLKQSDSICSALQYINFLQDVAIDLGKGRIYLPLDECQNYGLNYGDVFLLNSGLASSEKIAQWENLMNQQIARCEQLLHFGQPLCATLGGRLALEIAMTVNGGLTILQKIRKVKADVFKQRPKLHAFDWPGIFWRSLFTYKGLASHGRLENVAPK